MSVISSCLGRPRRPKRPQHPPRSTPAVPPPYPHYVYPGLMRFSTCAVPGFDKLCPVRVFTCRPRDSTRQQCTICLEYLVNDRDLVRRLPCAHEFHSNCILSWYRSCNGDKCPNCKQLVIASNHISATNASSLESRKSSRSKHRVGTPATAANGEEAHTCVMRVADEDQFAQYPFIHFDPVRIANMLIC
ncbi:hypothetical protein BWQ96_03850 [Gracilariopsis chorda]|uniref:RING-type E3 ubiquitin transferase n=1 Tax=Gracilariopsis chorda TaxID=448386 RepID=A0A2V3IW67_9FLOR|nr:hypothetical protein BWQ96_03850 [Gracilariopsis chorda]|eukprot:PXF46351.1 hypothetical protein BWQ96_03850 [Gracilariopsis chorda]